MACLTPYNVYQKDLHNRTIPVPCGKCPECLARRASGWSFRLMQECKMARRADFVTLTYGKPNLDRKEYAECVTDNKFLSVRKRHVQLFFKRLRKSQDSLKLGWPPIRYYAVGEYGTQNFRPHYHIILFNAKLSLIDPAWSLGNVHYGNVSGASIGYCLKYMCKPPRIPLHGRDDREKEFALMSKDLGHPIVLPQ